MTSPEILTTTRGGEECVPPGIRICSLLPSITDICIALGLADHIVAITHECDLQAIQDHRSNNSDYRNNDINITSNEVLIVTKNGLNENLSQNEIDQAIKSQSSCSINYKDVDIDMSNTLSFYPILPTQFQASKPTIVLTQTLCNVCAPSPLQVNSIIDSMEMNNSSDSIDIDIDIDIHVHAFQPNTLMEVVETFREVARVCGVPLRGEVLAKDFMEKLNQIKSICMDRNATANATASSEQRGKPKVLLLEWLDPPYDGGHWIPDMIEWVGCEVAIVASQDATSTSTSTTVKNSVNTAKSKEISWENIYKADPDVILIACCGFDLARNVKDALSASARKKLGPLRAAMVENNRVFACNGDMNFARPGPRLMDGIAVVAECVYGDGILDGFDFDFGFGLLGGRGRGLELEWERVCIHAPVHVHVQDKTLTLIGNGCNRMVDIDIEDLHMNTTIMDYNTAHREAVEAGAMYYTDPETKYSVMSELAHQKRGRCCGSGCRHCPYDHQNVKGKDKARKIKQPAFLYEGEGNSNHPLVCLKDVRGNEKGNAKGAGTDVKVLFFSGGKDSFLAIRAIVKQLLDQDDKGNDKNEGLCLVLLTTFDVDSRIIAHQEVAIEMVVRQAAHLEIPLIGVPMHRGTSESYVHRMSTALDLVAKQTGLSDKSQIKSLVFGDLHLEHIRGWRDKELSKLGVALEYPLWKLPYDELYEDFQRSNVEATVSAVTIDYVKIDEIFTRELMERVGEEGGDMFGENGEFHTFANVMSTTREKALGLHDS